MRYFTSYLKKVILLRSASYEFLIYRKISELLFFPFIDDSAPCEHDLTVDLI